MSLQLTSMPGYQANEYQLVLHPHEDLRNRIYQQRKEFAETYRHPSSLNGGPLLSLVQYSQYEMLEERMLRSLKMVTMGFNPFKVELKGFCSQPTHTIGINVSTRQPIQELIQDIRTHSHRLLKLHDNHKPHFEDAPYIPIARKLKPWQFEKGWMEYSNKHFTGRFIADALLVLKRRPGQSGWMIAERLSLQNLPVGIKQGELF